MYLGNKLAMIFEVIGVIIVWACALAVCVAFWVTVVRVGMLISEALFE
jgi:hypothetical protein